MFEVKGVFKSKVASSNKNNKPI